MCFISAANALPDQPIDDNFMVEPEGTVNLGPTYGSVRVAGMTIDEIHTTLNKSLHQWVKDPSVKVQLVRLSGAQPVTGQYLVGPDGTINLWKYGVVKIAGKTVAEARVAIQDYLKQFLDSPEISVDVAAYNSKVYYVITAGSRQGRQRPPPADHRQRDGPGCHQPSQRAVAALQARRSGLRGRGRKISAASRSCPSTGTPSPKGADGDQLPAYAGRPIVHCYCRSKRKSERPYGSRK